MHGGRRIRMEERGKAPALFSLPSELIQLDILPRLDAVSLACLEAVHSCFRRELSCERAAEVAVLGRWAGDRDQASRFRRRTWKERLHIEDSVAGFDMSFGNAGFQFRAAAHGGSDSSSAARLSLAGLGPKLLTSDASTAGRRMLRWRIEVRGNTAVEFGVVPEALAHTTGALHKQRSVPGDSSQCAVGFASQITAGSNLPFRGPIMRGSVVEILAGRGCVEFLLSSPSGAREMHWVNGQAVAREYRGPSQIRLEQEYPLDCEMRLAMTVWARGSFKVLHIVPGLEAPPAQTLPLAATSATAPQASADHMEAGVACREAAAPLPGGYIDFSELGRQAAADGGDDHDWAAAAAPQVPWQHFAGPAHAAPFAPPPLPPVQEARRGDGGNEQAPQLHWLPHREGGHAAPPQGPHVHGAGRATAAAGPPAPQAAWPQQEWPAPAPPPPLGSASGTGATAAASPAASQRGQMLEAADLDDDMETSPGQASGSGAASALAALALPAHQGGGSSSHSAAATAGPQHQPAARGTSCWGMSPSSSCSSGLHLPTRRPQQ